MTIHTRPRGWNYDRQAGVWGAWEPFTFELYERINDPPGVAAMELRSDSGSTSDDLAT